MDIMHPIIPLKLICSEESNFLIKLVEKGGPEPDEYKEFTAIVNNLENEELEFF